jgi:hypothetical protein
MVLVVTKGRKGRKERRTKEGKKEGRKEGKTDGYHHHVDHVDRTRKKMCIP